MGGQDFDGFEHGARLIVLVKCEVSASSACVSQKIENEILKSNILDGPTSPALLIGPGDLART